MADCLGRFGRASHSNPRYHSPTQNFGQVQMHVQRNSCDPCHQIRLCFICTPSAIMQDQLPCCSRPVERTRPLTVSSLVEFYKTCCLPSDQESLHAFRKPTLRVGAAHQPIRPAMLATLGAGSTPVFDAKSLASTSPRHVRSKTYTRKTAANVLRLSQVHFDTPWLSAGSLSWHGPTKVQWSFVFLSKAATSSDHVMASRCYHRCTFAPSGNMRSLMAPVASLVRYACVLPVGA
jgi:hypothetical protein